MFKRGIFSAKQSLLSMRPTDEAAAVLIIPLPLSALKCSTKPKAVRGLIKPEAAEAIGTYF